jgi:putative FmdB family regulatory protein
MPIYAYKCSSCGASKDILRKMSDPPLTLCPACGKDTLAKQLTAAGFQLKGSGWYVTDFREGQKPATGTAAQATPDKASEAASPASADSSGLAAASAPAPAATPAPAPAVAPASSTGAVT